MTRRVYMLPPIVRPPPMRQIDWTACHGGGGHEAEAETPTPTPDPDLGLLLRETFQSYTDTTDWRTKGAAEQTPYDVAVGGSDFSHSEIDPLVQYLGRQTLKMTSDGATFLEHFLSVPKARVWQEYIVRYSPAIYSVVGPEVDGPLAALFQQTGYDTTFNQIAYGTNLHTDTDEYLWEIEVAGPLGGAEEVESTVTETLAQLQDGSWRRIRMLMETVSTTVLRMQSWQGATYLGQAEVTLAGPDAAPWGIVAFELNWNSLTDANNYMHLAEHSAYDADVNPDPWGLL